MQHEVTPAPALSAAHERRLLWLLASIHFTTILDFLIIMPLGPQYMRLFHITPAQFGQIVSAYAISAGVAAVIAALFLDRFERKHALFTLYAGFCVGTLFCALAPGYLALVAARTIAGAFGGVTGAAIMAIVTDVVPPERRGRAMGLIMSSFSVASIIGVPVGLFIANHLGWRAPFVTLTVLSVGIICAGWHLLPVLRKPIRHGTHSAFQELYQLLSVPNHLNALSFSGVLVFAGGMLFPYISPYLVKNVGMAESQLPYVYSVGGLFTIFTMNYIGRLADKYGKLRVFMIMAPLAAASGLFMTSLPPVPLTLALTASTLMMICMSGRMVPAMALISTAVTERYRGGFMSINSAVQNFASGLATLVAGYIVAENAHTGALMHYNAVGLLAAIISLSTLLLARRVRQVQHTGETVPVEMV